MTWRSGFNSHQSHGNFFSLNCYALFFVTASIRKMVACPGLDLIPRRNGFQVIINDDFMMTSLKKGSVTADNSTLRIAYTRRFISMSGSRLFGSVVEHWIIDPTARVRFPPKSWDFFQPNLLCCNVLQQ